MYVLGINGDLGRNAHDPSAFLYKDGKLVCAGEEERYNRIRFSAAMLPENAINFCLQKENITIKDISYVAFPQETWGELFQERIENFFEYKFSHVPEIRYYNHHDAHAASSFYNSGFENALVITADGSGDGISTAIYIALKGKLKRVEKKSSFPDSFGLFYSLITQYLGFIKNSDEYKVMGMAAYGNPVYDLSSFLSLRDNTFSLNEAYLNGNSKNMKFPMHVTKQEKLFSEKMENLFGCLPRNCKQPFQEEHFNIAASAQHHLENVMKQILLYYIHKYNIHNVCLAGGVFMNCLMNGKLAKLKEIESLYVPPVCDDSGTAMGAAILCSIDNGLHIERINSTYFGDEESNEMLKWKLDKYNIRYTDCKEGIYECVAQKLSQNDIIGWFQGKMEIGARALGNRSILANPKDTEMKDKVNQIKRREYFQPFGSSVLEEYKNEYFNIPAKCSDEFMTVTYDATEKAEKEISAVINKDKTSRIQSVSRKVNERYANLLHVFSLMENCPVLLNTSLNRKGEPIARCMEDALAILFSTSLNGLAVGDMFIEK